jgi:predicted DNA binding protein
VIRLALDRGYFESPSEVTLAELATDLDITAQTLSRHIRSGVRKLVEDRFRMSDDRLDGSGPVTD